MTRTEGGRRPLWRSHPCCRRCHRHRGGGRQRRRPCRCPCRHPRRPLWDQRPGRRCRPVLHRWMSRAVATATPKDLTSMHGAAGGTLPPPPRPTAPLAGRAASAQLSPWPAAAPLLLPADWAMARPGRLPPVPLPPRPAAAVDNGGGGVGGAAGGGRLPPAAGVTMADLAAALGVAAACLRAAACVVCGRHLPVGGAQAHRACPCLIDVG